MKIFDPFLLKISGFDLNQPKEVVPSVPHESTPEAVIYLGKRES